MKFDIDKVIDLISEAGTDLSNSNIEDYEVYAEDLFDIEDSLGMIRAERRK